MTHDLERAAEAVAIQRHGYPFTSSAKIAEVCLRALLDPSPEVVEAIDAAYWSGPHGSRKRGERAVNAWRAGLNAILAAEGKDG